MRTGNGSTRRGFVQLLSGTAGAQLLAFLAIPILSRMYTPAEFGYLSLLLALSGLVTPSVTLRLADAAMIASARDESAALARASLGAAAVLTSAYAAVICIAELLRIGSLDEYPGIWFWTGVLTLLNATFEVVSQLALKRKLYGTVAVRSFVQRTAITGTQLLLGLGKLGSTGLVLGQCVGSFVGIGAVYKSVREDLRKPPRGTTRRMVYMYRRFPLLFTPAEFLSSFSWAAPMVFVAAEYGANAAGQLGMAEKVVGVPMMLLAGTFSQLVAAEFSSTLRNSGLLLRKFLRYSAVLLVPAATVVLIGMFFGDWIAVNVLGSQWSMVGAITKIVVLSFAIRTVAAPMSKVLVFLQRGRLNLLIALLRAVLLFSVFAIILVFNVPFLWGIAMIQIAAAVPYAFSWSAALWAVGAHDRDLKGA